MKKEILKKEIVLCRDEEDDIISYPTLWDAYRGFQEIKRLDKEEHTGISPSEYFWIFRINDENGMPIREQEVKFYVRNNKMYYKLIGPITQYEKVDI